AEERGQEVGLERGVVERMRFGERDDALDRRAAERDAHRLRWIVARWMREGADVDVRRAFADGVVAGLGDAVRLRAIAEALELLGEIVGGQGQARFERRVVREDARRQRETADLEA